MDKKTYIKVQPYLISMHHVKSLLMQGLITEEEYDKIDTIMTKKYGLNSCSIYRNIDWISTSSYGNMSD